MDDSTSWTFVLEEAAGATLLTIQSVSGAVFLESSTGVASWQIHKCNQGNGANDVCICLRAIDRRNVKHGASAILDPFTHWATRIAGAEVNRF